MSAAETTDAGIGLALLFGTLSVGAAVYTYAAPTQAGAAWGFAAAVAAATIAVAALHVYGE